MSIVNDLVIDPLSGVLSSMVGEEYTQQLRRRIEVAIDLAMGGRTSAGDAVATRARVAEEIDVVASAPTERQVLKAMRKRLESMGREPTSVEVWAD